MLRDARFGHIIGGIGLLLFGMVLVDWHDDEDKRHVAITFRNPFRNQMHSQISYFLA